MGTRRSTGTRPTMKDVAQRAGVALSSVSRVLNGHPDVSDIMKSRVFQAISDLGYERNLVAAGLRKGNTRIVGFIVADLRNQLYGTMVTAAQRELSEHDYAVMVTTSDSEANRDESLARALRLRQVDALVVSLADETHDGVVAELRRFKGPIVLLDRALPKLAVASSVQTDHGVGIRMTMRHLLGLGHLRIGLITGPMEVRPSAERAEAFVGAYRSRGLEPPRLIKAGSFSPDFGEESALELFAMESPPTALICGGNHLLVGVLRALATLGISPGMDIALASCDDTPLAELHSPPITVIDRDVGAIGRTAARLALERLADPDAPPQQIVHPTNLVVRASTSFVR